MWLLYVFLHIIFSITFTQLFKIVAKNSKKDGTITIILQLIAGLTALLLSIFLFTKINSPLVILICLIIYIILAIIPNLIINIKSSIIANIISLVLYSIISFVACMIYISRVGETAGALIVILLIANMIIIPADFIINLIIDKTFNKLRKDRK